MSPLPLFDRTRVSRYDRGPEPEHPNHPGRPADPEPADIERVLAAIRELDGPVRKLVLCAHTGLHERMVRRAIQRLAKRGEPIVSDYESGGYVYTEDPDRLQVEITRLRSRSREIAERADALETARERLG